MTPVDPKNKMRANRDTDRDWLVVNTLRAYDAPIMASELQALLPDVKNLSSVLPKLAVKYDYPVWRIRGSKAGSTNARYVYSDTQPHDAVRKFLNWSPSAQRLQDVLDIDLTEDANLRVRHARAAARDADRAGRARIEDKEAFIPAAAAPVVVDPFASLSRRLSPTFELLESREAGDVIIFRYNDRVFVGRPVRI